MADIDLEQGVSGTYNVVLTKPNDPVTCGEVAIYLSSGISQQIPTWSDQALATGMVSPSGHIGGLSSGYPHHQTDAGPSPSLTSNHTTNAAGQSCGSPNSPWSAESQQNFVPYRDKFGDLPSGWERRINPGGRTYYLDHNTRTTTWDRPLTSEGVGPLPSGWEDLNTSMGVIFLNKNTGEITRTDPRCQKVELNVPGVSVGEVVSGETESVIQMVDRKVSTADIIKSIPKNNAQAFIDELSKALDVPNLHQETRKRRRQVLYKSCGYYTLLPSTMQVPVLYDRSSAPFAGGGFGDVYKGESLGREVAVKVIRAYLNDGGEGQRRKIGASFSSFLFLQSNMLTPLNVEILQGGRNVEVP